MRNGYRVITLCISTLASAPWFPTQAEELLPKDYSPTDRAAIRTVRLKNEGGDNYSIVVAIANRSNDPFNANFACTVFDKSGAAFGSAAGAASGVPPKQEVAAETATFSGGASKAVCRIEFTVPTE
jgi:hypothetical protein